jgi:predicted SAM-dependent methyltransferase
MGANDEESPRGRPVPLTGVFPRFAEQNLDPRRGRFGRLLGRVLPRHVVAPLRFELHAARVRLGARAVERRLRGGRGLRVNLGCGDQGKPGWVNVDLYAAPGVNCLYDCRKRLPFADGAVVAIFCEHFFEHLDFTEEVPFFLDHCRRVLEPGGVLRIVVPDFERYLRAYVEGGWDELARIRPLEGGPEARHDPHVGCTYRARMELLNVVFRQAYQHKFAWDFETLAMLLERHGFREIERRSYGESRMPEICLDHPARASESLYVEAIA